MKLNIKNMLIACMFALPTVISASTPAQAAVAVPQKVADDVKVQVNDSLVQFPDAQPFLDENHKLQVPARVVADKLGYQVQWEPAGSEVKVTLKKDDKSVSLTTGDNTVTINGKSTTAPVSASLIDGRVYVPFRLIADSFNINTQWDNSNRIAILGEDGKYHAPAWYKPKVVAPSYSKIVDMKATAYTASPAENGGYGAIDYLGQPLALGTIAVDPSVIPLGSKVYVEGYSYDGLPTGGMYAIASDTGSAIKGNKIDIFLPESRSKAQDFGVQQVKVYVIGS
ncbi:stalk domain-containing protein [Paenibacillus cremeus]|uniref:3D (Asp-Asp-Asp) domain-containing protein n=1 Tax=Paenibacillus cremeus TaxID=2163881 RepID=A0A559K4E5_9BACL|nr:stalk domain-containing protein [Paenibacillus cremeus]TVY06953.1 hypothetical protein FPZ49_26315 [Paenibacillus cremeus]